MLDEGQVHEGPTAVSPIDTEVGWWMPGHGMGRIESYYLMDVEFLSGKRKKLWKWMELMVTEQCECTKSH